jgi:hypothetical protein
MTPMVMIIASAGTIPTIPTGSTKN